MRARGFKASALGGALTGVWIVLLVVGVHLALEISPFWVGKFLGGNGVPLAALRFDGGGDISRVVSELLLGVFPSGADVLLDRLAVGLRVSIPSDLVSLLASLVFR